VGDSGEFTVWVDDVKVAEKHGGRFPDHKEIVEVVRARGT
jgi:predicted Rdx family selenoprotein